MDRSHERTEASTYKITNQQPGFMFLILEATNSVALPMTGVYPVAAVALFTV